MMTSSHPNLWEAGNSQRECKYLCSTQKNTHNTCQLPLKKIFTLFFHFNRAKDKGILPKRRLYGLKGSQLPSDVDISDKEEPETQNLHSTLGRRTISRRYQCTSVKVLGASVITVPMHICKNFRHVCNKTMNI